MKDIFDSLGSKRLKLMAYLTIAIDFHNVRENSTYYTHRSVIPSPVKKNEGMRKRGRATGGKRDARGRSQLALRFGQRANERNKARVIKITVVV